MLKRVTLVILGVSCFMCFGQAHRLPPIVQLGGAIVAAVEQDAEQEAAAAEQRLQDNTWLSQAEQQLRKLLNNELTFEQVANMLINWSSEARGKHKKNKKLLKMLYPLLAAGVLAKLILLPLILKWLTALSASSFVMAKIALVTAGLLALKSILSTGHGHDKLQIIHATAPAIKGYHGDLSSSGSSWVPMRQQYIPLGITKDAAYRYAPQPGYDSKELYKPFL